MCVFSIPHAISLHTLQRLGAFAIGFAVLTISSYITVPMDPVPLTMQTLAVTLVGGLFGWRMGAATVAAWLAAAMMGLPVLAEGAVGIAPFLGPTSGYLFAFPAAAALTGFLISGRNLAVLFVAMTAGNALCLLGGAAWLTIFVGPETAVIIGVMPFALGAVIKSALGATILKLIRP